MEGEKYTCLIHDARVQYSLIMITMIDYNIER